MPESISTFFQGLDSDSSKTSDLSKKYRDARNWRLITEEGSSSGSLESIRGNRLYFSLPTTSPVLKFKVTGADGSGLHGYNDAMVVTVNSGIYTLFVDPASSGETNNNSALRDIFILRINSLTSFDSSGNSITNPLNGFKIVAVKSGSDEITMYSTGTVVNTLSFSSHATAVTTIVAPQSNLRVIGWTTMRDDFILITCSNDNNFTNTTTYPGQIWRLSYTPDSIGTTYSTTLTLLYNNLLNLYKERPIASPGAILGRYENQKIQRIYWTDNFNRIRKFNVADKNGFGVPIDNIDLVPITTNSVPIFERIDTGGTLLAGVYQYAYSLLSSGGQETLYSSLSNMIPVNEIDENDGNVGVRTYDGVAAGTATTKQLKITISRLDTNFDTIRIIALRRENSLDIPEIKIILEEPLPSTGEYSFTHTGNEGTTTDLALEEFTITSTSFTHCKTIEQKDNVLFAGNVRNERLNIDFDARAFRFDTAGDAPQIALGDFTSVPYQVGINPDAEDDINPDQYLNKFQVDGATIGGTGVNISYEIKASGHPLPSVFTDRNHHQDSQLFGEQSGATWLPPYRQPTRFGAYRSLGVAFQLYEQQGFFQNYMHPAHHGLYKGYMRDEIYRFAIVFFSKDGTPDFARWIADIKMPQSVEDGTMKFPVGSYVSSTFEYYTHPLFVEFTVNLPVSVRSAIGGYSIVRVKRNQGDKTILSQGVLGYVNQFGTTVQIEEASVSSTACEINSVLDNLSVPSGVYTRGFFPDSFFENNIQHQSGDKLKVVSLLGNVDVTRYSPVGGGPETEIRTTKAYFPVAPVKFASADIDFGVLVQQGAVGVNINDLSNIFNNRLTDTNSGETVRGQKCFLMRMTNLRDASGATTSTPDASVNRGVYLVNYIRPNASQYGGNTLAQKSVNTYMSCGHFQPITEVSSLSNSFDLFGGDIFLPVWDFQERLQDRDIEPVTQTTEYGHVNYFVPVETTLNIDMRTGLSVNRNAIGQISGTIYQFGGDLQEGNVIEPHYNLDNDVTTFVAKPVDFDVIEEYDNRVHASQIKINGEESDKWTKFLLADIIDVEGTYGPINNLVKIGEQILYFQDKGFGSLSINPRVVLQDQSGVELQLGTGTILEDFTYISTEIGCKHQWGMTVTRNSLVFFDIYTKKMYRYVVGGGVSPISDIKGLQSFFANNLNGPIQTTDNPLLGTGITATYDKRFNEAIFTFLDTRDTETFNGTVRPGQIVLPQHEISINIGDSQCFEIGKEVTVTFIVGNLTITETVTVVSFTSTQLVVSSTIESEILNLSDGHLITVKCVISEKFTIAYNDQVNAFTSFYDFFPSLYINDRRVIITPNPADETKLFVHNENDYVDFYGTKFNSTIQILVNPAPDKTKVFDNLQWYTEATIDGADQPVTTFNTLRCRNDYQDSGVQTLVNNTNIKRKERNWNTAVPRASDRSRMRDKTALIDLEYVNNNNVRLVFHYLKTFFRQSAR